MRPEIQFVQGQPDVQSKRPYRSPELKRLGTVADLTLAAGSTGNPESSHTPTKTPA